MEYREIVAVTGLGGLFQLMATKADGAIVRNLADNTTRFISARLHNVTPLESIEIYTTGDNVRLHEVFELMKSSDTSKPDPKSGSGADIKAYFKSIFPDMDEERVYASDMKKMLKWFELLAGHDLLDFSALKQQQEGADSDGADNALMGEGEAQVAEHNKETPSATEVPLVEEGGEPATGDEAAVAEKPAKKARTKKAAAPATEGGEEKPKKTAKKKKEEGE